MQILTRATHRYSDDHFEYRHVQLPKQMLKAIPKDYFDGARGTLKLLWEDEWRGLGITQVRIAELTRSYLGGHADKEIHRAWGGNTTKSTNRNRTFCCSSMPHLFPILHPHVYIEY